MQKIKNIEFLRTFLIFPVVILHMFMCNKWCLCDICPHIHLYQLIKSSFFYGNYAVEAFFIISGFLLVLTFKNSSIRDFIVKKYIRLSSPIAFSMLLCLFGWGLGVFQPKIIPSLLTIFLLNNFGYCWAECNNGVLWFTSVLFFCILFYFCLLKFVPKKHQNIIISIFAILAFGGLEILKHGSFSRPLVNYYHIFNVGTLRGLGGVGLGCLIGNVYKSYNLSLQNLQISEIHKWLVPCAEFLLLSCAFWWLSIPHAKYNCIIFVIVFALLFSLFICKKGYLSNYLDNDIWVFLGKYQYSMYVVHYIIIKIFGLALWRNCSDFVHSYPVAPIVVMLLTILIFTIFTYHFVEEPCAKYLKQKLFKNKTSHPERISGVTS